MDERAIQFHIDSRDLFGTAATVVDLVRQDAERHGFGERHALALQELRDQLMYLQEQYGVVKSSTDQD